MAVARFCPHGNLRVACAECKSGAVAEAQSRAAANRARGESGRLAPISGVELPYPWQRESLEAWQEGGRVGLVALSLGLPTGDLPYALLEDVASQNPSANILVACANGEADGVRTELTGRFGQRASTLLDHHFLEPREDGTLVVAELQELETVDLPSWGRFASTGLLVLLDADGVNPALGQLLLESPFRHRFSLSRQPSAIDLLATRPWSKAFGPTLYRMTEEQVRDLGILPRMKYRLHVEMLKPEPAPPAPRAFRGRHGPDARERFHGPEGPWEPADIPTRITVPLAGAFVKGRARDVAISRAKAQPGLLVVHDGIPVPGAAATMRLADLPDKHAEPPSAWVLATPGAEARAVLRLATVAFKTLGKPGVVEDAVVLPVPADLCRVQPWHEKWRLAAVQIDRVVAGLLLAESVPDSMSADDLETLVGVALALRGLPADELHKLTPVVAQAAAAAHAGESVDPEKVRRASRAFGGFAASLLVAAELGPLQLLRLAHPRFTPVQPDLPHPSLYDARRHAWRGRAFAALASAAKAADLVTAWGRYPELRFVFPSSALLEAATAYCTRHKLKAPLDDAKLRRIEDGTRIAKGDRAAAAGVLGVWNDSLGLAEEHERQYLADMHARQPERERRREGVALPALAVAEKTPESVALESRDGRLPATNIAPGCEVALVEAGGREEFARGIVSRISTRRVLIEFPAGAPRQLPREVTVNLVFDAKVFEAYHSAVVGAQRALSATTPQDDGPDGLLRSLMLGEDQAKPPVPQPIDADGLTPSQKDSIEAVLAGGRVRLIHGPPGTGKTHTLVRLSLAIARAGHSVLVTADSNAAVDNLVVGIRRAGGLVVRVGHAVNLRDANAEPARIDPMDAPLFVRWAGEQGVVVATTNYGAFRYIDPKGGLTPYLFDYVIHDEAGQSTAPSSLAAVMRGRRLVLAGDPKQLPPTVVSMDAKEAGLDVTLFERIEELTGTDRTTMLRTQFRMREPILAFSNKRYYDSLIETAPVAAAREGLPDLPAMAFQHVTGRENDRQKNGSISNDFEVGTVAALIERFRGEVRDRGWTLAVLTPYQAQREALRRRLPDVEVSTVDGAQGREWDIVLYSSVRSNPAHRLGFVSDERRLNVAVTRARRHFILVGDERTLRDHDNFRELLDCCEKVRLYFPDAPQDGRARGYHEGRGRREATGGHPGRQPERAPYQDDGRFPGGGGRGGEGGRRGRRRRARGREDPEGHARDPGAQGEVGPSEPVANAQGGSRDSDADGRGDASAQWAQADAGKPGDGVRPHPRAEQTRALPRSWREGPPPVQPPEWGGHAQPRANRRSFTIPATDGLPGAVPAAGDAATLRIPSAGAPEPAPEAVALPRSAGPGRGARRTKAARGDGKRSARAAPPAQARLPLAPIEGTSSEAAEVPEAPAATKVPRAAPAREPSRGKATRPSKGSKPLIRSGGRSGAAARKAPAQGIEEGKAKGAGRPAKKEQPARKPAPKAAAAKGRPTKEAAAKAPAKATAKESKAVSPKGRKAVARTAPKSGTCVALTAAGTPCRSNRAPGSMRCARHA